MRTIHRKISLFQGFAAHSEMADQSIMIVLFWDMLNECKDTRVPNALVLLMRVLATMRSNPYTRTLPVDRPREEAWKSPLSPVEYRQRTG